METLRIYISTWNVSTNAPMEDLSILLDCPTTTNKPQPDFYVLGFQEVKSQPQDMLLNVFVDDPWTDVTSKLLAKADYVKVRAVRLQGLLLLVFCKRKHLYHVRDVEAKYTRTGLGGIWGNKGAVTLRLCIYGCSLCFVNAHLSAHEHQLDDRVKDYNYIVDNNKFTAKGTESIFFHDYIFWFGDLNFRLHTTLGDSPETIAEKVKRAEKDDYSLLLLYDQLRMVMESQQAFSELKESTIQFPPTFKFVKGTDEYDPKRKPSWTDRILYKFNPNNYDNITLSAVQLSYQCLSSYNSSDHKPVMSEFNIKIRSKQKIITHYGARSGGTMIDAIPEERVVFSNYTERCIEFAPINNIWYFGDADLQIEFTISSDVEVYEGDWIGIYDVDFIDLDNYIAYEYVRKVDIPNNGSTRHVLFSFAVGSGVRSPGFYRFVYFNQPSSDIKSVLGISSPFEVRMRDEDSVNGVSFNPPASVQVPTVSGKVSSQDTASTSQEDASGYQGILKRFSAFNLQNDLSID